MGSLYEYNFESVMENDTFGYSGFAYSVLTIIAMWKIFMKAGEKGWKTLIPIYNIYIEFKIAFGSGWYFLLLLIPIVNIVYLILLPIKLGKAFGKSGGFIVGLIFLPFIFQLILAFDSSTYLGVQK